MGRTIKTARTQSAETRAASRKTKPATRTSSKSTSPLLIIGALALFIAALLFYFHLKNSTAEYPPEKFAAEVLTDLSSGKKKDFMKKVDVAAFVSTMDSTGLTRRDYAEADRSRTKELEASHGEMIAQDLFISANMGKNFEVGVQNAKEMSAIVTVKPWIQFDNRLYRRLLLEKRGSNWKVTGLASPDA